MTTTIDGSAGVTTNSGAVYNGIASGTAVASTSGTSIDFTGIPSWVKRITVMFNGVSTSGTSFYQIQLGAGSVTTTGYINAVYRGGSNTIVTAGQTTGFGIAVVSATSTVSGSAIFSLVSGNNWSCQGTFADASANIFGTAGSIALGGTLDRVRITTVNGTDTFDAGSINILYE